jgi:hypothetical protein
MVKWTSVMTHLLTWHIKDGCEWSKSRGTDFGKPMSNHVRFILHWSCPFEMKWKWLFVNDCKCRSLISIIEFLNRWKDGIYGLNLSLVSHVSLWLSEPYLLNILCATKTFQKYFHVDDDGSGSGDNGNQPYTSYLHLVSKWLYICLMVRMSVCSMDGMCYMKKKLTCL